MIFNDWNETNLDNSGIEVIDGDRGKNYPNGSDFSDEGYCLFLNAKNVTMHGFIFDESMFITKDKDELLRKGKLRRKDIVLTTRGTVGNVAYFNEKIVYENMRINSGMVILRCLESKVLPEFAYWLFRSPVIQNQIKSIKTGSAQPQLPITVMKTLKFLIPSLIEQKAIADTIFSLDDKIELNNHINKNLEEMAQAIFKSWFVDFEPFQDGEFQHSDLRKIPKGWRVGTLDDVTSKFATGLNPRKNFVLGQGDNYYVTIKNMGDNQVFLNSRCDKITDEAIVKINNRSNLEKGDLLFSGIGTIGRVYLIDETPENWNISESVFTMRSNKLLSPEILYMILLSDDMQSYAHLLSSGSVQKGIRMADLKKYKVLIPNKEIVESISDILRVIIAQIRSNQYQNKHLCALRDSLLPKLMSGEIRVPIEEVQ